MGELVCSHFRPAWVEVVGRLFSPECQWGEVVDRFASPEWGEVVGTFSFLCGGR